MRFREVTMARPALGMLAPLLALSAIPAAAAPALQITGKILNPPRDVQVELRPWAVEHAEALRRLKGEAIPPITSARPRPDGSFAVKVPDTGFYSVVVRAEGHVAMERFVQFVVEETEVPPVELALASPLEVKAVGADGQPLAGVTIQALPLKPETGDWRAAGRSAVTDAEGRAVFHRAEGEELRLVVTTPGRYSTASTVPAGASQTVRFPSRRTRMVEFRGANGKPASGALVRLAFRGWPYGLTGEDGRIPLPVPEENEIGLFAEDAKGLRIEVALSVEAGEKTDVQVVTLRSPTLAAGRVLDASSREPIAGALVWNGRSAWTRTGAGGTFELRAPSGDRGYFEASAAGRMVHFEPWERERNAALTFLLEAAAPISGRVVDEEGKPVEGARITTLANTRESRSLRMQERSTSSGPDGRFSLGKLPAGQLHALEAVREGFAPAHQLADSKVPVRLVLRRGTLAFGRIVDEEGLPVAEARVSLAAAGEAGAPYRYQPFLTTSDPEGRFRIPRVSAGRFDLRAESQGFAATVVEGVSIPEQEPEVDLGEIRLLAGGAIEGIVTDTRGKPVEKAWIDLSPSGGEDFMTAASAISGRQPTETGPDGRFRIENLPRGVRFDLHADHAELQPAEVLAVEVPTAEPLRIRLSHPQALSGRVVDELGGPIAGASVSPSVTTVAPDGSSRSRIDEKTTTDPDGRFRLSRVSPGAVQVQASAPGYRSGEVLVQVPEEGETEPVEITLGPGTSLEGQVLDRHGLPVRRARMELRTRPGNPRSSVSGSMADEEGRYEMVDLEPGPYEVAAYLDHRGRATRAAVEIRPGRNRLDLRFGAGVEVSGRVLDSRGEPVPGAGLSLEAVQQQDQPVWPLQATSSADGSFVLADVADGEYRLVATRQGFGPSAYPEIRVDGAPVSGLELRLSPGAVIRGRILGLQPEEVRGVTVGAFSESFGTSLMGTLSPEPAYRIADVAPGEWHVSAHIAPGISIQGKVEVAEGIEEVVLDLELPTGFTLTGRVFVDREPLPKAFVMAASQDLETQSNGTTGQDGAFRLERLPAGSYVLMVQLQPDAADYRTLEIGGDLDVTVEISTGSVEGRILLPEGMPASGATITLAREVPELETMGPNARAQSDGRGAFTILRVPTGTYKMTVQAEGFAPAESRVVVAPGGTVRLEIALGVLE
ncbi:MAG TPA: carboxypeptidase regulatory-like domain-containing protein [Thermoanaerobaculia bacterium]|nr:carboxypeptidase regulatory-like domain-containing protein [Thermoanaerobaculia bacterium]